MCNIRSFLIFFFVFVICCLVFYSLCKAYSLSKFLLKFDSFAYSRQIMILILNFMIDFNQYQSKMKFIYYQRYLINLNGRYLVFKQIFDHEKLFINFSKLFSTQRVTTCSRLRGWYEF